MVVSDMDIGHSGRVSMRMSTKYCTREWKTTSRDLTCYMPDTRLEDKESRVYCHDNA